MNISAGEEALLVYYTTQILFVLYLQQSRESNKSNLNM